MTMMPAMMHSRAGITAYTEILLNILPLHQILPLPLETEVYTCAPLLCQTEAIGCEQLKRTLFAGRWRSGKDES
jgi:hypothetical protein